MARSKQTAKRATRYIGAVNKSRDLQSRRASLSQALNVIKTKRGSEVFVLHFESGTPYGDFENVSVGVYINKKEAVLAARLAMSTLSDNGDLWLTNSSCFCSITDQTAKPPRDGVLIGAEDMEGSWERVIISSHILDINAQKKSPSKQSRSERLSSSSMK